MKSLLKDVAYWNQVNCDIYIPDSPNFDTIVYFHGGGLKEGDKADASIAGVCTHLCEKGYGVISCNYTLYPQAKKFQYVVEASHAVAFAKSHIKDYGGNGSIILAGQSAGAWMIMLLCFDAHYLKDVGIDPLSIKAWLMDAGQPTTHFNFMELEYHCSPWLQRIDEAAPLYFINEVTQFTNVLLIVYENDIPNRLEQNKLLISSIKTFNAEAKIELKVLEGTHCHGSICVDEDGEYGFVKAALTFLNQIR